MSAQQKPFTTPEEYLRKEAEAFEKSEYIAGEIIAMAGATPDHNTIVADTAISLGVLLREKGCGLYLQDQRVQVRDGVYYHYPDISVVCGKADIGGKDGMCLLNPLIIIEVASPSTSQYDRGEKFAIYRAIDSLAEYVIIHQDQPLIERYLRQPDEQWLFRSVEGLGASILLDSIHCTLKLTEVYARVTFPEHPARSYDRLIANNQ